MTELFYKQEVYAIVGAAMEVYNQLGPGFLEPVYQEALEIEFALRGIPFRSQQHLTILYKKLPLEKAYVADFVAFDQVIVEIKALDRLATVEESQLLNYLKATCSPVGVLINFGGKRNLEWKRMVLTETHRATDVLDSRD